MNVVASGCRPRMSRHRFDLVVFDLDGTLVNSLEDIAISINYVLESYGFPPLPQSVIRLHLGNGAPELVRCCLEAAGIRDRDQEALSRYLPHYRQHCLENTRLYPGTAETLNTLGSELPLAVLTNKPIESTRMILQFLGIDRCFSEVVGGDTLPVRKPDPAGLQWIIDRFGCASPRTLMVGDSMIDIETGSRAGVPTCGALYGLRGDEIRDADFVVSHPAELLGIVLPP